MISWKRESVFQLLCLFGDAQPHSWLESVNLGTRLFVNVSIKKGHYKTHQAKFEAFFQKAIEYGLIEMIETDIIKREHLKKFYRIGKEDYNYKISKKGDKLLRQEQAERSGDSFYFHMFNRSTGGDFGIDRFAPLNPINVGIQNKQTYKVKNLRENNEGN